MQNMIYYILIVFDCNNCNIIMFIVFNRLVLNRHCIIKMRSFLHSNTVVDGLRGTCLYRTILSKTMSRE